MPELRIGVDVRPLCHPGTGIYRYTRELLLRLCNKGGRWYFYSPQPYDSSDFKADNIVHCMADIPAYLGGSQASQLLFPHWIKRDAIDVFWGPRHHLPLLLPKTVRSVLTIHDLVWRKYGASMRASRRWSERMLMPQSLARADQITVVSHFVAAELTAQYPKMDGRVRVVPGASSQLSGGAAGETPVDEPRYFLFVGTMEPRKNLPQLLRAYKAYLERCPEAKKLKVVGAGGWGNIDPNQLVSEHELGDRVEVLGKVSDAALSSLYCGAHALVMPSLYEGFGLPVVEALAHGVPAIVSRDSALSEVAGKAGFHVDPLSPESICAALCALTQQADTYAALQEQTKVRASAFSWEQSAVTMYEILCGIG